MRGAASTVLASNLEGRRGSVEGCRTPGTGRTRANSALVASTTLVATKARSRLRRSGPRLRWCFVENSYVRATTCPSTTLWKGSMSMRRFRLRSSSAAGVPLAPLIIPIDPQSPRQACPTPPNQLGCSACRATPPLRRASSAPCCATWHPAEPSSAPGRTGAAGRTQSRPPSTGTDTMCRVCRHPSCTGLSWSPPHGIWMHSCTTPGCPVLLQNGRTGLIEHLRVVHGIGIPS